MNKRVVCAVLSLALTFGPARAVAQQENHIFKRLVLAIDNSGSGDAVSWSRVNQLLVAALPDITRTCGVEVIEVLTWATPTESWRPVQYRIQLPRRELVPPVERKHSEASRILKLKRAMEEAEAVADSTKRQEEADKIWLAATRDSLAAVESYVASITPQRSVCTSIVDFLTRCALEERGALVVAVTDAKHEPNVTHGCPPCSDKVHYAKGAETVLVIVPAQGDGTYVARWMQERMSWVHETAPWARCVPSFRVGPSAAWLRSVLMANAGEAEAIAR